ncbi:hypothetical protein [Lacisediminihabitans sp. H27-G8]|uniref:COG4705 family protein n=1 Tax=Lacisediminihabitans sp. H27-G8 TaxID=3111909 RepID=UPI0038FC43C2
MTVRPSPSRSRRLATTIASKVPEVTVLFWIVKVLTTGMGETTSDFLVRSIDPVVAVGIGAALFAGALTLQFLAIRYRPWIYWLTVVAVSIFGTMAADVTHIVLGVPYLVSSIVFGGALALVFLVWHRSEGTLSIHSITSRRRELFYWAAVVVTFALGTAVGDLTATTLHLGYLASGLLFAVVIAIPAVAFRLRRFGPVFAFWFAYVATRPLGASFADWMGVSHARGGLQWGTGPVSVVLAILIAAGIAVIAATEPRRLLTPTDS